MGYTDRGQGKRFMRGGESGCIPTTSIGALMVLLLVCGCASKSPRTAPKEVPKDTRVLQGWSLGSSGIYYAVAVSDLNGDGMVDIVGGSVSPGTVAVWLAEHPGVWSSPTFLPIRGSVYSVAVADFTGDGRPDLCFSIRKEMQGVRLWVNLGDGKWKEGASPSDAGNFEGLLATDINEDGKTDLLAAAAGIEGLFGIKAWIGDGAGGWREEAGPTAVGEYRDVTGGDFNGDGHIDLVGSGYGLEGGLRVWLGNGRGNWSKPVELAKGTFNKVRAADVDRDGNMDVLSGTYRQGLSIHLGDGRGSFRRLPTPDKTGSYDDVIARSDSKEIEVVATSLDNEGARSWNLREGKLHLAHEQYAIEGTYHEVLDHDLDGDGRKDLAATTDGNGIRLWLSTALADDGPVPMRMSSKVSVETGQARPRESIPTSVEQNEVFKTVGSQTFYRIGAGDVLEVTVWKGAEQKVYPITVRGDGKVSFSFVQDVPVDGLTFFEVAELLKTQLRKYIREPSLEVKIKEHNSKSVTVLGAIMSNPNRLSGPGIYTIKGRTTILTAISIAGGYTSNANLQQVSLRRKNGATFTLNLFKTITRGDISQDVVVDNGDTIMVPELTASEDKVFVLGEVIKPGAYPVKGPTSLLEVLSLAGGSTDAAVMDTTTILRGDLNKPQVFVRNLRKLLKEGDISQNIALQSGDVVFVPRTLLGNINAWLKEFLPIIQALLLPLQVQYLMQ